MSIIRRALSALVAVSALTVMAPGHAETPTEEGQPHTTNFLTKFGSAVSDSIGDVVKTFSTPLITFNITDKDEDCLARNIFYEAASEPEEGKVAVGMVTINRVKDGRFANSICGVVKQKTVFVRERKENTTEYVQRGWFGNPEPVPKTHVIVTNVPVCQFSWVCNFVRVPKVTDERWEESKRVAHALLNEEYPQWIDKYNDAIYFHSTSLRPVWAKQKHYVTRVGGHMFYADSNKY